jgi:hypothetical protein
MTHTLHEYREDCPGCQLALMDASGRKVPETDPVVKVATKIWLAAPLEERRACNRVWVHGSTDAEDFRLMKLVCERIQKGMEN